MSTSSLFILICLFALSIAEVCKPRFELIDGECLKRCGNGQIRNAENVCEKECYTNSHLEGGKCVCNAGFDKVESRKCAPACGENMRRKQKVCICEKGFVMKGKKCTPIECPTNEELRGSKCYCVKGTSRLDGVCTAPCSGDHVKRIDGVCQCGKNYERYPERTGPCVPLCGLNSRRLWRNGECVCLLGFEEKLDSSCRKIRCPRNEVLKGNKCYCIAGTSRLNGVCLPPCPEHMKRFDGKKKCECKKNYEMYKNKCVRRCGRNSRRKSNGVCVCDLGFEEVNGRCKAIRCGNGEILDGNACVSEGGPAPTKAPTRAPTRAPTQAPTKAPTRAPTRAPTQAPTKAPTQPPTPSCPANSQYVNGKCTCNAGFVLTNGICKDNRPCAERDVVPGKQWQLAAGVLSHVRGCGIKYMIKTREEGRAICTKMGAELAAVGHMVQLFNSGETWCACGWVTVGLPRFSTVGTAKRGCGLNNRVNTCAGRFMGRWGGPGWDVYCFSRGARL